MKKNKMPIIVALVVAAVAMVALIISKILFPSEEVSKKMVGTEDIYKHFLLYDGYTVDDNGYNFKDATKAADDQIAIIVQDKLVEDRAKLGDGGRIYLDIHFIREYIDDRFYWDNNENILLFTTATDIVKSAVGSMDYYVTKVKNTAPYVVVKAEGQQVYVCLDFVKLYSGIEAEFYQEPNRLYITNDFTDSYNVGILKAGEKVRIEDSRKSDILVKYEDDMDVIVVSEEENWLKVVTKDGYIGYAETKSIKDRSDKVFTTTFTEPEYTSIRKDRTISMAWHQVTNETANNQLVDLVARTKGLNVISPTWFRLSDNEGNFTSLASHDYVIKAHMLGLDVWAMIDDQSADSVNAEIFPYTSKRERIVNQLVATAIDYNLDGINIDFEYIDAAFADAYIQFLRELSVKCRVNGIVLSVDDKVPAPSNYHYNRKAQGKVADYIIIMGYDEHWGEASGCGSVASLPYVTEGILNTISEVDASKVINAIPFYTRIWQEDGAGQYLGSQAVGIQAAIDTLAAHGASYTWVENVGQNYGEYATEEGVFRIWLEDAASIEEKLKLIQTHNIAGVSAWRLGLETPEIWNTIIKYTN